MDDYHKFARKYDVEIDALKRHWYPNYMSFTQGGIDTSGGASDVVTNGGASSSTSEETRSGTSTPFTNGVLVERLVKILEAVVVKQLLEVSRAILANVPVVRLVETLAVISIAPPLAAWMELLLACLHLAQSRSSSRATFCECGNVIAASAKISKDTVGEQPLTPALEDEVT
ncbi:hypothetical protein AXG93_1106s1000 [Marchantia polymorpha subsp. ruderalis]|uniref:Uncharacterized protein n=1 Tax=Marchantia polymorpha subsp. ruderalis TaxID=1480154 RepID=A0A176VD55_MARPO|nr:hypothetical protein AXG93_1106s1000 [Marchantia polymorpha subsp. ruderalis]